jgi:hypothetical protein
VLTVKLHGPTYQKQHISEYLTFARYETTEGSCTVHVIFNLPASFILLIIDYISVLICSFSLIFYIFFHIVSANHAFLRSFIQQCKERYLFLQGVQIIRIVSFMGSGI